MRGLRKIGEADIWHDDDDDKVGSALLTVALMTITLMPAVEEYTDSRSDGTGEMKITMMRRMAIVMMKIMEVLLIVTIMIMAIKGHSGLFEVGLYEALTHRQWRLGYLQ